jgi:hypothetical protein
MALVSPGISVTVTDNSQYISNQVGTVPLVVMATAQDKTLNGTVCSGTTKANAGTLQVFGSQRDLSTAMGYPIFQQSSAGTPLHGDELNEYGLMAAYSALGLGNQLYGIRADIDLNQLSGTSVRPTNAVADGTYWLDLADTTWGIYEWSADTQTFSQQTPIVISSSTQTTLTTQDILVNEPTPLPSVGQVGSYAVVATTVNNRIFYKAGSDIGSIDPRGLNNTWVLLGTPNWHASAPMAVGTATNPTLTTGGNLNINGTTVTLTGSTLAAFAANVNSAGITGVKADVYNNQIAFYGDSTSSGLTAGDGRIHITTAYNGTGNTALISALGLTSGATYNPLALQYSSYASVPYWTTNDTWTPPGRITPQQGPTPNGSVWFKVGAIGGGANFVFKKYNATTQLWNTLAVDGFINEEYALAGLDPSGGGVNIANGTVYMGEDPTVSYNPTKLGYAGFKPKVRQASGAVTAIGSAANPTFTNGAIFTMSVSQIGLTADATFTITLGGTGATDFVSAILRANIPNVTASVTSGGNISITHLAGGVITLTPNSSYPTVISSAGFVSGVTNVYMYGTSATISGFNTLTYTYNTTQPVADPANGTLWYYSDPTVVDVMINTGTAWKGYQNVSADVRGYNLQNTDPTGVIVSASAPTTQSDGSNLMSGDLWLDSSDLENWPKLSRYASNAWVPIDNTDQVSQNGILFADARWDNTGLNDPASGTEVATTTLLTSDYLDLDAPNPLLYPRGMLLLNTRRSGYNVKRYVADYFTPSAFTVNVWSGTTTYTQGQKVYYGSTFYVSLQNANTNQNPSTQTTYWSPLQVASWVTDSGLKNDGSPYAGHYAQRQIIVAAMNAALEANTEIREDQFNFSLICAPGYPELIANMVSLNNDRANTAFVIGDTPMGLSTNVVDITNWSNDTLGTGLATADPYLAVYYPSGLSTDLNGNTIMVPPSHMALRTYLYSDNVSYPWFAPAGTRRGLVSNATDLGYINYATGEFVRTGVQHSLRDALYQLKINPITILTGVGMVVWGQKTRDPNTESMDRVNVARLVNYLRTIFASAGNAFLFEPNDKITRDQFAAILNSAMNDLVAKRAIYDYLVVCDTTNNTPDIIANNELYADVAIEPEKAVEFIYVPIRLYNPGQIAKLGSQ